MTVMTFRKSSKTLRAYEWLWGADPAKTNFCKLFWAFVFAPLALLILKPLRFVSRRKATGEGLDRIEHAVSSHPRVGKFVVTSIGVLYGCCILGLLVYAFVVAPIVALITFGGAFLFVFVLSLVLKMPGIEKFGTFVTTGYKVVKTRTCPRVEITE